MTTLILAGTATEAKFYARMRGLKDWVFVSCFDKACGHRDVRAVETGTFYRRHDQREIRDYVRQILKPGESILHDNV